MTQRADGFDLDHHGDLEVGHGLVDLAVNVRAGTPPAWLVEEIGASLTDLAAYPRQDAALAAVANRHHRDPSQLLLTAGAAEAFVLIARAFRPRHPVVVHPQFTEPEAALRSAGHLVDRVVLSPENGFVLDPRSVPADADLVVIGNPTNPTSVLHRADDLRELARPDRILVVDEAFMDAVPGEPESLLGASIPGLVVVRSLTKTWGLAGLRVGYLVAAPGLIEQLASVQPHWPVSTPALAAAIACSNERALGEAGQAAVELDRQRAHLLAGLTGTAGVSTYGVARGPFVLVRVEGAAVLRERLRERGFAVRRGDTFPGLGPDWLRIAVRPETITDGFLKVWQDLLG
ncbi:Rv2231c family pyridoxal phosphate-dependent protein CobC [Kribbella sp. CA-293567]|uniref:Rv2231c family pyridoxal phosphate-dependent protein CobC n=1 Tax=Kribbella sp. CA-293567 TaxID=3002436 RepID=UPI0022DD18A6|nr:Rv2231c family pyridoxal phosphate-dependent protein CobC [Kribbella sp. CA-293567]WBQ05263.1 Rv2231c family pyridoxal phosphate-dependent protein CobC [Kribbella sp. CA-293567]